MYSYSYVPDLHFVFYRASSLKKQFVINMFIFMYHDTIFWPPFQFLQHLLNTVCIVEKQRLPIYNIFYVWLESQSPIFLDKHFMEKLYIWSWLMYKGRVMVFNATFNNISVISWQSVLFVEETGVPGEYHRPATSHWQTLSHNVVSSTPCLSGIWTFVVNGTDCI